MNIGLRLSVTKVWCANVAGSPHSPVARSRLRSAPVGRPGYGITSPAAPQGWRIMLFDSDYLGEYAALARMK
jgi:hypothetical protein